MDYDDSTLGASLSSNSGQVKVNRDPPLNMDVPVQKHDQMVQFPDVILHRKNSSTPAKEDKNITNPIGSTNAIFLYISHHFLGGDSCGTCRVNLPKKNTQVAHTGFRVLAFRV